MNHRILGKSQLQVSEISFGCMSLDVQANESENLLRKAADSGINFFDTADLYDHGENEILVGRALKPIRDQVMISTKVGNQWRKDGSSWDWNPSKKYILEAAERSLQRLQSEYIDLYQLHGGTKHDPIDETIEAFELLKQQGKIREYGISSIRPNVIREWVSRSNISSVMMQYSLLDRRPEEKMLDFLGQHSISVLTRGTLAKGLLLNKPAKDYLGYSTHEISALQKALNETGSPIGASINFALSQPAVASSVLGIRTSNQLDKILSSYRQKNNGVDFNIITNQLPPKKYENHR